MRKFLVLLAPLMLSACVDGTASYLVEGPEHALAVRARQDVFWNNGVSLTAVLTRLPDCQRQLPLDVVSAPEMNLELFDNGERHYILRDADHAWEIQTETCGMVSDKAPAPTGPKLGTFKIVDKQIVFEREPAAKEGTVKTAAPAPAAEETPAAAAPAASAPAEAAPAASQ